MWPHECSDQSDKRGESLRELFIARGDPAKVFDKAKMAFNEIAILVLMRIIGSRRIAVGARRDDRLGPAHCIVLAQLVSVKGFVGEHRLRIGVFQQSCRLGDVMYLTLGQHEFGKASQPLDQCVDLGCQPSSGASDRLRLLFLAAPEECCWARTMVLSRNTSSKSASLASSANTFCQIPLFDHRAKRTYTLFQCPNSLGKSRHGLPVRATNSTASINSRLFRLWKHSH